MVTSRRVCAALLLVGLSLAIAPQASGQAVSGCPGKGVKAPEWFTTPPTPPRGVYQAEARSGPCRDAETAQKAAIRLAAWLLVHEKSAVLLLEETQVQYRLTREEDEEGHLFQDYALVERAIAGKVLERSWVHAQDTYWTADGLAEHFVVLRADTSAVRQVAADELAAYFGDPEAYVSEAKKDAGFSEGELEWLPLPSSEELDKAGDRRAREVGVVGAPRDPGGPRLRRVVLSWQVASEEGFDPGSPALFDRAYEARIGLNLARSEAKVDVALAGEFRHGAQPRFSLAGRQAGLSLERDEALTAYFLVGPRRPPLPVYGGFRVRSFATVFDETGRRMEESSEEVLLGVGYPRFTERAGAGVENLYLEAVVWPKLRVLEAGAKLEVLPVLSAFLVTGVEVIPLGEGALVRPPERGERSAPGDRFLLARTELQGGLELVFFDRFRPFVAGHLRSAQVVFAEEHELFPYVHLFRAFDDLSREELDVGMDLGVRLAF